MNVVNQDFQDWFLAYHLRKLLQSHSIDILCVLGWRDSTYFGEIADKYRNLVIVHSLYGLSNRKGKAAIAILDPISPQTQEHLKKAATQFHAAVWNLAKTYAEYESVRMPDNYIVDEFHINRETDFLHYTERRDAISAGYISRYIFRRYEKKQLALFNKIELETLNRCNGSCCFCPVNHRDDPRHYRRMDEELYTRIIDQLRELKYDGALALFSNNEPLLDKRIPVFAQYARAALPDAFIYIYTNGTLLTWPLLTELLQNLDWIHVDCYGDKPELQPRLQDLRQLCHENKIPPEKITFHLRNEREILTTRAGNAPNRRGPNRVESLCPLPFSQMIVRPDGKVSQCCNDALGQVTLGDLTRQTIKEVWFGTQMEKLRESMLSQGRKGSSLCSKCDTIFTCLPYEERSLRNGSLPLFTDYSDLSDR